MGEKYLSNCGMPTQPSNGFEPLIGLSVRQQTFMPPLISFFTA